MSKFIGFKFSDADFNGRGVRSLPDEPQLEPNALKAKFDELVRSVVAPKLNAFFDFIESEVPIKAEVTKEIDDKLIEVGAGDMRESEYVNEDGTGVVRMANNTVNVGTMSSAALIGELTTHAKHRRYNVTINSSNWIYTESGNDTYCYVATISKPEFAAETDVILPDLDVELDDFVGVNVMLTSPSSKLFSEPILQQWNRISWGEALNDSIRLYSYTTESPGTIQLTIDVIGVRNV